MYALHGEIGGVVVDSYAHPAVVLLHVVNTVGNDLAKFLVREVVRVDLLGVALGPPLSTGVLVGADQLFLLGINGDRRLTAALRRPDALVDVLELGVAIRVLLTLDGLAICLQAVALGFQ